MIFSQFCYDKNQRNNISSFGNFKFCCFQPHLLCVACEAYNGESKWRKWLHLPAIYDNVAARVEDEEEVGDKGDQVAPGGETEVSLLSKLFHN